MVNGWINKNKRAVTSIGAAVFVSYVCQRVYSLLYSKPKSLKGLPAIRYIDIIKSLYRGDDIRDFEKNLVLPLLSEADGVYTMPRMSHWIVRSCNPKLNRLILSDTELFPKDQSTTKENKTLILRFVGGKNITSTEGHEWKRHRNVIIPFFQQSPPVALFGKLTKRAFSLMEKMGETNCPIDSICQRMTLDVIGITGFDFDFECTTDIDNKWISGYGVIEKEISKVLFITLPVLDTKFRWLFPKRVVAHQYLKTLLMQINDMIAEKKKFVSENMNSPSSENQKSGSEKDILTLMIESGYNSQGQLSDEELLSNVKAFFFAGHETTSNALSSLIFELGKRKDIQDKVRQEVLRILGNRPEDIIPTQEQLKNMVYLDAAIKEALRMNPPVMGSIGRISTKDFVFNNIVIPKGTTVSVDIIGTHMNPELWDNPEEFRPERFMNRTVLTAKDGLSWLPFGHGPHVCIGMNFSYTEQKVFLSMLLRRYDWELPDDSIHKEKPVLEGLAGIKYSNLKMNFKRRF